MLGEVRVGVEVGFLELVQLGDIAVAVRSNPAIKLRLSEFTVQNST